MTTLTTISTPSERDSLRNAGYTRSMSVRWSARVRWRPVVAGLALAVASSWPGWSARLLDVEVQSHAGGTTEATVVLDGPLQSVSHFSIGVPSPRLVVVLAGVSEAYRPYEIAVADRNVARLRIGHHPEHDPPREHLVFDLTGPDVRLVSVDEDGDRVVITLAGGTEAAPTPRASAPPTARPTPSPQPTPPPSPTLRPTAPETRPARPPANPPAILLEELVVSHRPDGATLVRVSADTAFAADTVDFFAYRALPPRYVLRLHGASPATASKSFEVFDTALCTIEVVHDAEATPPHTDLVLHLASTGVSARRVAVHGAHAAVELGRLPGDPSTPECEARPRDGTLSWDLRGPE
jgi:hypothetical protein